MIFGELTAIIHVNHSTLGNTDKCIMCFKIISLGKEWLVGCDKAYMMLISQFNQCLLNFTVIIGVTLQFNIQPVTVGFAEF